MKDAQGHGSNGRGGPAKPIPNSPYHMKSDAELRYIVKDASEAERASRGMTSYNPNGSQRSDTSGKYADQVNDAASVLGYRDRGGLSMHPNDVAARDVVSNSDKSGKVPTHDSMGALSPGGRHGYNLDAVNDAISAQNRSGRGRIGGREAKMIHALLKGR